MTQIEPLLLEVITKKCTNPQSELYETGVDILSLVMYYIPSLTPAIWNLFQVFINNCIETTSTGKQKISFAFENQINIFNNYIGKAPADFITGNINGNPPVTIMINLFEQIMQTEASEGHQDFQKVVCMRIYIQMLECLKGQI